MCARTQRDKRQSDRTPSSSTTRLHLDETAECKIEIECAKVRVLWSLASWDIGSRTNTLHFLLVERRILIWPLPYAGHPSRWLWQSYVWVLASLSAGMGCRWLHRRHYGFIDTITLITPIVQQTVLFNIRMNSINQSSPCQPRTNVSSAIFVHFFLFFFFLFSIEIVNVPAFGTRSFRFDIEKVFFLFCRCPRRK